MKNSLAASLLLIGLAVPAVAQEPRALMKEEESPQISVSAAKEISSNSIGLMPAGEAGLPDTLWKDATGSELQHLLQGITGGIVSPTVRSLTQRALAVSAEYPDAKEDLLADRANALIEMGQAGLADQLLAQAPQGYRTERQEQLAFLLNMIKGGQDKAACAQATDKLATHAEPFWQRWVVLCQAKAGESDKAQLGLDLLSEQNEFSEFFQKVAQAALEKKPLTKLPEVVFFEQAAWLVFIGQQEYLATQKNPPLALLGLTEEVNLPEAWKASAQRYGVRNNSLKAPSGVSFQPNPAEMNLPANAEALRKRRAFLTYGLRKALSLPVAGEVEAALSGEYYRAVGVVLSPSWRDALHEAAQESRAGKVILLLAGSLTGNLNHYAPADLAAAVEALMQCGLEADASALAQEALAAAR